jgi:cell division transport system permease protein
MSLRTIRRRARSWGRRQLYSFFSSLGTLIGHRLGTAMTVLVLGIAMALPLGLYVTVGNLRAVDLQQEDWGTVTVFLKESAGPDQAGDLAQRTASETGATVELISPEQGLQEFRQVSGFGNVLELLDENPLPWVLQATPRNAPQERIDDSAASLARWLEGQPEVDLVQVDYKWLRRLASLLALGDAFISVLTVLFSVAVVVIVANTIRLDVANRSEEIQVLNLVGASNSFIRQPFLYSGFWYGLLGALLALFLLAAAMLYVEQPLARLLDAYGNTFDVRGLDAVQALGVLALGGLLGLLGAWAAVQRYLRRFQLEGRAGSASGIS